MMKMIRFILLTVVLFSLLTGTHCFALDTANQSHEQVCVNGNIEHSIVWGETLSGIAKHYGQTMGAIQGISRNGIVNRDKIYAGKMMFIPCAGRKVVKPSTKLAVHRLVVHRTVTSDAAMSLMPTLPTSPVTDLIPLEIATPMTLSAMLTEAPAATIVAAVPTQPEQEPAPSPPRKSKKVKGYQLVFSPAEAKDRGIILNRDLQTQIFLFHSEKERVVGLPDGEIHNLRSRAERKDGNVVLDISLKQLPDRPFVILINGLTDPIDGNYCAAHCKALQGRFPGPRMFNRIILTSGKMLVNTAIVTALSGGNLPLGIGVGFGLPIVHSCLQRHFNAVQQNAEAELALTEAQADAKDFIVLHQDQGDLP